MFKQLVLLVLICAAAKPFAPRNANPGVRFVGSKLCAACHRDIYESFFKTSMGRSFAHVNADLEKTLPPDADVAGSSPGHSYHVGWQNGRLHQSETFLNLDGARVKGASFAAEYLVGSGANGYSFLFQRDNQLFEEPLSYYSRTRNWDLSPGFDAYDAGFSRPVRRGCLECHVGRLIAGSQNRALPAQAISEQAIGCENCHGPGELHVRERGAQTPALPDDSIVNPANLAPALENAICIRCHQGNDVRVFQPGKALDDFRPGTTLDTTVSIFKVPLQHDRPHEESDLLEHGFAMLLSKCYLRSGQMTCVTCHSVHRTIQSGEKVAYYRSRCLTCHSVQTCTLDKAKRQPDDNCAGCHMPARPVAAISHTALTNHRIVRNRDEPLPERAYVETKETPGLINLAALLRPDARSVPGIVLFEAYRVLLGQAPTLKTPYLQMLERLKTAVPDNPDVLAAAGHELLSAEQPKEAIGSLEKAWLAQDSDPEVCLDLADALRRAQRRQEAEHILKQGLARYPYEGKLHQALIALALQNGDDIEARQAMTSYLRIFPADTKVRMLEREIANTIPGGR